MPWHSEALRKVKVFCLSNYVKLISFAEVCTDTSWTWKGIFYSMACMAYHGILSRLGGDQKMCAKCVLSLGVCVCVCACVNVNDRCARCRAHFSQWEEHQAIYTRSSGGALSWLCANFEISCWWKVYEHNTEIIGDSHVRNTSRFHTKPRDPMLCPGGPGAAEVFLRRLVWSGLSWLVAVVHMGHMSLDVPRSAMQWSITMVASTWTQTSWY